MKLLRNSLLETFVTVVECGGFTDAQFALGITQSAVSLRIRDLEAALGYRVCDRGRGGFRLTERGEIAYEKAKEMLCVARDFDAELLELRGTITGELRIGIVDAVSTLPGIGLIDALRIFMARPNEVKLEIFVASPTDLTQGLIDGSIHVAVSPFRNLLPELSYVPLCTEEHRLYCGLEHPLYEALDSDIGINVLKKYPLCQRSYDLAISLDPGMPEPKAVVANMEAMAMLIESGHYLGALPRHFAEAWIRQGKFRELNCEELRWESEFYLATRRTQVHRRAVELFANDVLTAATSSLT